MITNGAGTEMISINSGPVALRRLPSLRTWRGRARCLRRDQERQQRTRNVRPRNLRRFFSSSFLVQPVKTCCLHEFPEALLSGQDEQGTVMISEQWMMGVSFKFVKSRMGPFGWSVCFVLKGSFVVKPSPLLWERQMQSSTSFTKSSL